MPSSTSTNTSTSTKSTSAPNTTLKPQLSPGKLYFALARSRSLPFPPPQIPISSSSSSSSVPLPFPFPYRLKTSLLLLLIGFVLSVICFVSPRFVSVIAVSHRSIDTSSASSLRKGDIEYSSSILRRLLYATPRTTPLQATTTAVAVAVKEEEEEGKMNMIEDMHGNEMKKLRRQQQQAQQIKDSVSEDDATRVTTDAGTNDVRITNAANKATTIATGKITNSIYVNALNFSSRTALNFMHLHKTGGNSLKNLLRNAYTSRTKRDGTPILSRDACYKRVVPLTVRRSVTSTSTSSSTPSKGTEEAIKIPSFDVWRCDWLPVHDMRRSEQAQHDIVFGHQYPGGTHSIDVLLSNAGRDVRAFTVLRHPLARKLSFYFHFFVRERGREQGEVTVEEIKRFLLNETVPDGMEVGKEAGPNYYAGRLLSNGSREDGFVREGTHEYYFIGNEDDIQQQQQRDLSSGTAGQGHVNSNAEHIDMTTAQARKILDEFVFVGLQTQWTANRCMLRFVTDAFDAAHGVTPPAGPDVFDEHGDETEAAVMTGAVRDNVGGYGMSAKMVWGEMTEAERRAFEARERTDLEIYKHGRRLFRERATTFGCERWVVSDGEEDED